MDSAWLVPLSLAFGVALGVGLTVVIVWAERRGHRAAIVTSQVIPDGIDQVIEVLDSVGVVLDPSNNVLKASPGALAMGLVWNDSLVHPELVKMVDTLRRTGEPITEDLHLARGPFGEASIFLKVRVARLGSRFILLLSHCG